MIQKFSVVLAIIITSDGLARAAEDTPKSRQRRVANGAPAQIESYPYLASVQTRWGHKCGGTILSELVILTAAHCIGNEQYYVRVGSSLIKSNGSYHKVIKTAVHEHYQRDPTINDVALLRLDQPIEFDKTEPVTKAPVQLFESVDKVEYGSDAVVIGWGANRERRQGDYTAGNLWDEIKSIFKSYDMGHYYSTELRHTTLKIAMEDVCVREFNRNMENQICAFGGANDTCKGDSGGPLMVNGRQAGITSWGVSTCGTKCTPGGYVSIPAYRKWIDENLEFLTSLHESSWFGRLSKVYEKINPFRSLNVIQFLKKLG